jgi:hypothetical protein
VKADSCIRRHTIPGNVTGSASRCHTIAKEKREGSISPKRPHLDRMTRSIAKQSRLKRVNIDFTEEAASRQDDKVDSKKISFEKSYIY